MKYTEVKKEYVIRKIESGQTVLVCNFDTKQIHYVNDMTIGEILELINKSNSLFFNEEAEVTGE